MINTQLFYLLVLIFAILGVNYNRFVIGTNNLITFDTTYASTASGYVTQTIPSTTAPLNAIMGPWQDIHPGLGGIVSYKLYGTAPFRHLTVSWYQIPMFSCTGIIYTSQVKIYETTGIIESHILDRQICAGWNDGNAVHGLHNFDGTFADVVPGRNNTAFSVTNEGYRWTPQGTNPIVQWFDMSGTLLATGDSLSVSPTVTTSYICKLIGNACGFFEISDTVEVSVAPSLDASFTYPSSTYCPNGGVNPIPTLGPGSTGAFDSSPTGIVFVSNLTGEIDVAGSTPGTYQIVRFDSSSVCPSLVDFTLTITNNPIADYFYSNGVYCASAISTAPIFNAGGSAGVFSSAPSGLVFADTASGEVDLVNSAAGTYIVTNSINAIGCPAVSDTSTITIEIQTIDAGAPVYACTGNGATLLGVATGPNSGSVTWTGGSGTYANINNDTTLYSPSLNDVNLGVINLTLTMNGTTNCPSISDDVLLTIELGATAEAGNDVSVCDGGGAPVVLNGSIGGLATTGTWSTNGTGSFGNALALSTVYTPSAADISNGGFVLYLTTDAPGSGNCPPAVDSLVATLSTQPTISTQIPNTACAGSNVLLSATSSGSVNSYNWSTSNGSGTFTSPNNSSTQYVPGIADINQTILFTINGIAAAPCNNVSAIDSIQIIAAPTAVISGGGVVQTGNITTCPNGTTADVNILLNGNGPFNFTYTVGDDTLTFNNITTSPYIYQDSIQGPFNIISLSDQGVCPGIVTGSASVDTVNISYLALAQAETCGELDGIAAVINLTGGDAPYTYLWNNGSSNDSIANLLTGVYSVIVSDANNCTAFKDVLVPQVLGVVALASADPISGGFPLTVNFTNNSTGAINYLWNFGDGDTSIISSPTHIFELQGEYQIVLTAYNTPGCKTSDTLTIIVDGDVPNVFTPNGDGSNDKFSFNRLSVKSFNAQIFNRWGKKVFEWTDPKDGWDGSESQSGVYYYIVTMTTLTGEVEELHGTITLMK
jgi:gliding motility-associated-like protein